MIRVTAEEVGSPVPELYDAVVAGEEVIFWQNGEPLAKLIRLEPAEQSKGHARVMRRKRR